MVPTVRVFSILMLVLLGTTLAPASAQDIPSAKDILQGGKEEAAPAEPTGQDATEAGAPAAEQDPTPAPKQPEVVQALHDATHIDRLHLGPVPTSSIRWDQPHEGNLFT